MKVKSDVARMFRFEGKVNSLIILINSECSIAFRPKN